MEGFNLWFLRRTSPHAVRQLLAKSKEEPQENFLDARYGDGNGDSKRIC